MGFERLYYEDSFLRSFSATVADIREVSRGEGESVWQVALDRTAFYPTSGGQPHDVGVLRVMSRGGAGLDMLVEGVEEDEQGEIWHFVRKPLSAGTQVEGEIDWDRRLDHMQQHTGQHVLSAIFLRELQAPTVSFHLGDTTSTIDLATGPIPAHSLDRVERLANRILAEDLPVTVRFVERAEAEQLMASGKLRKLPDREGRIRLIEISEVDANACGGTHVRSTGQIGGLFLRSTEKVTRGLRVEFVCGLRAVEAVRADRAILAQATTALSVGAPEVPSAVERLKTESKAGAKERQRLREDLASYHATRLAVEETIQDGLRLVERTFKDRDRDYVKLLASRVPSAAPSTAVVFCTEEANPARIYVARSMDLDFDCGRVLREVLAQRGLRGGGSADLAQGDVPLQDCAAVRAEVAAAVRAAVPTPLRETSA